MPPMFFAVHTLKGSKKTSNDECCMADWNSLPNGEFSQDVVIPPENQNREIKVLNSKGKKSEFGELKRKSSVAINNGFIS